MDNSPSVCQLGGSGSCAVSAHTGAACLLCAPDGSCTPEQHACCVPLMAAAHSSSPLQAANCLHWQLVAAVAGHGLTLVMLPRCRWWQTMQRSSSSRCGGRISSGRCSGWRRTLG